MLLPLLCLLPLLSACQSNTTTPINFDTDPQILRGHWTGTIALDDGRTNDLIFDFVPAYSSGYEYAVTGTGSFDTAPFTVTGRVSSSYDTKFIRAQMSPVISGPFLDLKNDQMAAHIRCGGFEMIDQQSTWHCNFASAQISKPFTLHQSKR